MSKEFNAMPCPFCGGNDVVLLPPDELVGPTYKVEVACDCGAVMPAYEDTVMEANCMAIANWNLRAAPKSPGYIVVREVLSDS